MTATRTVTSLIALPASTDWLVRYTYSDGTTEDARLAVSPKFWMDAVGDLIWEVQDSRGTSWTNGEWTRTQSGGIVWRAVEPTIVRVW